MHLIEIDINILSKENPVLYSTGVEHGIHGFMVPIRDNNLQVLPNVTVEDMGFKMGLNGVDNAKLTFDNVRIPRVNLLNRYVDSSSS